MAEPWIRVHADLVSKPVIGRLARTLSVSPYEAMGVLVTFWGNVSRHAKNGHVGEYDDEQLDTWGGWPIRRGQKKCALANFIRQFHLDADGRVNEWDEYAGALENRREKERERLRNKRHGVAQQSTNGVDRVAQQTHDVRTVLQPTRANETRRDETTTASSSALVPVVESAAAKRALDTLLGRAPASEACATALWSMQTGNDPAVVKPTQLAFDLALIDYVAKGEPWSPLLFRRYLKRAGITEPEMSSSGAPEKRGRRDLGGTRNDAALKRWLAKDTEPADAEITEISDEEEVHHGE